MQTSTLNHVYSFSVAKVIITILTIARVIAGAPMKSRPPEELNPYRDKVILNDSPIGTPAASTPRHSSSVFLTTKSASASEFSMSNPVSVRSGESSARGSVTADSPGVVKSSTVPRLKKSESELLTQSARRRTDSPQRSARPSTAGSVRSSRGLEKITVGQYVRRRGFRLKDFMMLTAFYPPFPATWNRHWKRAIWSCLPVAYAGSLRGF